MNILKTNLIVFTDSIYYEIIFLRNFNTGLAAKIYGCRRAADWRIKMQLKKRDVKLGKAVYDGEIKSSAEGSIIVPDVKPDIMKVLQVDAESFLCERLIDDGKITLKGRVNINVLYLPENGAGCVQCIKSSLEFCETLKRSEFTENMRLFACCDTEKVSYKLINSRKISVDAQLLIDVRVTADRTCSLVCGVEESSAQMRRENICLCSENGSDEFSFNIEETVDFPHGKAAAAELLKTNVVIFDKEYKALSGKLVVKGKACVSVLYADENNCCSHMDFELPFTEVFDMEGLTENSECEVIYETGDTDAALSQNADGEMKCIVLNIGVCVSVRTECREEVAVLSDCYFTDSECQPAYEELETENVIERPVFSAMLKEILQKEQGAPEIAGIYTVCAKPYITATQIQSGRLAVSGKAVVYVLYITDNPQMPVCSINEEIPFSYMIDCENAVRDAEVLLTAECEHVSYAISSSNSVEIRCGICISGKMIKKTSRRIITDVSVSELPQHDRGIVIYFTKSGDTLWDIAKHYHVKGDSIIACNDMGECAEISGGEKLIIPVSE